MNNILLAQVSPDHPLAQVHVLGALHVPPLRHGDAQPGAIKEVQNDHYQEVLSEQTVLGTVELGTRDLGSTCSGAGAKTVPQNSPLGTTMVPSSCGVNTTKRGQFLQ